MDSKIEWIEKRIKTEEEKLQVLEKKALNFSNLRGLVFFIFIIFAVFSFNYPQSYHYHVFSIAFLLVFSVLAFKHKKILNEKEEIENIITIIMDYQKKKDNELKHFEFDGSEEIDLKVDLPTKNYLQDLHIIGEDSLFKFLNISVSKGGRERLVQVLSNHQIDTEEIKLNQDAVEELSEKIEFLLFFQEKLRKISDVKDKALSIELLKGDIKNNGKKSLYALIFSSLVSFMTVLSLGAAVFNLVNYTYFEVLFILQLALSFIYMKIFSYEFSEIDYNVSISSKFREVYSYISETDFKAKKNNAFKAKVVDGKDILSKIVKVDNLDSLRKNIFSYTIFNVIFPLNTLIVYKFYSVVKDKEVLRKSMGAIEEFEMLASLSTLNLIKANISKPEIRDDISFECKELLYPLLDEAICVSNDFKCEDDLNIITGSNMSGKTSFMRSVGVNLVLAYAGAYVNASVFKLPMLRPFTSINVKDDISKGISTFYGELLRIKDILTFAKNSKEPMIVFIDEIFKGTNYADRIFGAKKVLEKLSQMNCIVFLTTHDFELCEVNNKKIKNYHFSEEYKDGKMVFTHKIKIGECETTNAKELMKEIGIV